MTFSNITTTSQLANLLGIKIQHLTFVLYKIPDEKKYRKFTVPKKSGGERLIYAPIKPLREIQKSLLILLQTMYEIKSCSHGFEKGRNILSNAKAHLKSKILLNIDIQNFFESINYGRVRGLFLSKPFFMSEKVATVIAQIICYENKLPQGACTSPIIANMITRRMDSIFIKLAESTGCRYSRYVDDISFSSTKKELSKKIVSSYSRIPNEDIVVGDSILGTIKAEGFSLNIKKTRLQNRNTREEVTGVVINEFPNIRREFIRNLRMMLFVWKKYGLKNAADKFRENHYLKQSKLSNEDLFKAVIIGRISHIINIRGKCDSVSYNLCKMYKQVAENTPKIIKEVCDMSKKYQVFIGHASEDKEMVAEPLYEELEKLGVTAFLDKVYIKWGDSITQKINKALGEAEVFLAIISKKSKSKLWPQKEINSAITRNIEGKLIFLPLFVGTKDEIEEMRRSYSLIGDLLYKEWNNNPYELAGEIQKILS